MYNRLAMDAALRIISVAIGGAFGAVARYLVSISPLANVLGKFPLPTFIINVMRSFLIGLLMILLADRFEANDSPRLILIVGFLGAFTTFSTYELEIFELFQTREFLTAFLYLFLSVFAGFLGVVAGTELGRRI